MRTLAEAIRKAFGGRRRQDSDMEVAAIGTARDTRIEATASHPSVSRAKSVRVSPTPVIAGEKVQIMYAGTLAKTGARNVILHWGIGPGAWQNVQDVPMDSTSSGTWTCTIVAADGGRLEFCFHDGAGNWDNNTGENWRYTIHNVLLQ